MHESSESQPDEEQVQRGRWLGWGVGLTAHACAVIALALAVVGVREREVELPPTIAKTVQQPEPAAAPIIRTTDPPTDALPIVQAVSDDVVVPDQPSLPDPAVPVEDTAQPAEAPAGRVEALASEAMPWSAAIGTGHSVGQIGGFGVGRRDGWSKAMIVRRNQGTRQGVTAVKAALQWLARHQSPDGGWSATDYWRNCAGSVRCEPGQDQGADTAVALTGYALLCFLGDGHDPVTPGMYRATVQRGIAWLQRHQSADGAFSARNYEQAIATMAMAQALAMSPAGDGRLRRAVESAVRVVSQRQNQETQPGGTRTRGLGWDYGRPSGRNDGSVTGWNVMALKSALGANIDTVAQLTGCRDWLTGAWRAANSGRGGTTAWQDISASGQSRFPYCWTPAKDAVEMAANVATAHGGSQSLESVALMCAAFLGAGTKDEAMVESLANTVMAKQLPTRWPCNTYYLYYNTLGMFQVGGERWRRWNEVVNPLLVQSQRRDGCFAGSWDWEGTVFHGSSTGRVLSTAYCCLSLEVYWIYERMGRQAH